MPRRKDGSGLSRDVDEAREQILAAAEVVILRYGIPKTTMDDIGREAGVSRPTVYRYFGDREALVGALIERRSRMLFERARTFILSHETFAEQLIEGLVYLVDHGRKDPIVRILVSPEHMGMTRPIVGGSNLATNLTAEMWEPIFRRAMERVRYAATSTSPLSPNGLRWFNSSSWAGSTSPAPRIPTTVRC